MSPKFGQFSPAIFSEMMPGRLSFRIAAVVLSTTFSLVFAALFLSWRQSKIQNSNDLSPSLFLSDPILGWRLKPGWSGEHKHYDFTARYSINSSGFRTMPATVGVPGSTILILGDSFTFGLGVQDDESFPWLLSQRMNQRVRVVNAGIPGYSSDQEYLLGKELIPQLKPRQVLLLFYLGNDVFDNARSYPVQLRQPKPLFRLATNGLQLLYPLETKAIVPELDFDQLVLGSRSKQREDGLFSRALNAAGLNVAPANSGSFSAEEFLQRRADDVQLTMQILQALAGLALTHNADFSVALLPGRSYVEEPNSVSAKFQEALESVLTDQLRDKKIRVLDLAAKLRGLYQNERASWYYPHDGHLNPEGHKIICEMLLREIAP